MLQRGVETADMDVRWVSSLSWYFLNFFGLNGLYRLLLTDTSPALDGAAGMMMAPGMMGAGGGMPGQPQDFGKLFKAEKDNLELATGLYKWTGADVELRMLRKYGRIPK